MPQGREFWPGGARLVISISMPFEAGGPPPKGSDSPFPKIDLPARIAADLATNTWFAYGYREGILRMLDLWDRQGIKVTSHIISEAAQRQPALAKDIVQRDTRLPYTAHAGAHSTPQSGRNFTPGQFLVQIELDFDQLCEEGATRCRMMSISEHDRISGTPARVRVWDEFLRCAKSHPGVAFMRKDDIAKYAINSPLTLRENETI